MAIGGIKIVLFDVWIKQLSSEPNMGFSVLLAAAVGPFCAAILSLFSLLLTVLKTRRGWGRQNLFWLLSVHHERGECVLFKASISQPTTLIKWLKGPQVLPGPVTSMSWWVHMPPLPTTVSFHALEPNHSSLLGAISTSCWRGRVRGSHISRYFFKGPK